MPSPDDRPRIEQQFYDPLEGHQDLRFEYRILVYDIEKHIRCDDEPDRALKGQLTSKRSVPWKLILRLPYVWPQWENSRALSPMRSTTHTAKKEGVGLGLAISRRIEFAHGGWLQVEPRDGGGAEFHLLLPAEYQDHG